MNLNYYKYSAVLLFFMLLIPGLTTLSHAFPVPERLVFEISYAGMTAGRAVQEVERVGDELHITSTAKSADWINLFFPVDDKIESFLISSDSPSLIGVPRLYRERIREGWTRFQKDAVFDRQKLEVNTKDFLKKSETTQKISRVTYDTLSSFFYFRTVPLETGTSHYIDIFDCKKLWNTEVQVLRREEIETSLGRFKTVVIKPLLKSEGIFARTGEMHIWLTDDDRRIPVLMKSKVKIGSITATLVGGSYWPTGK